MGLWCKVDSTARLVQDCAGLPSEPSAQSLPLDHLMSQMVEPICTFSYIIPDYFTKRLAHPSFNSEIHF